MTMNTMPPATTRMHKMTTAATAPGLIPSVIQMLHDSSDRIEIAICLLLGGFALAVVVVVVLFDVVVVSSSLFP